MADPAGTELAQITEPTLNHEWRYAAILATLGAVAGCVLAFWKVGPISSNDLYRIAGVVLVAQTALWGPLAVWLYRLWKELDTAHNPVRDAGRRLSYWMVMLVVGMPMLILAVIVAGLLIPDWVVPFSEIAHWRRRAIAVGVLGIGAASFGWIALQTAFAVAYTRDRWSASPAWNVVSQYRKLSSVVRHLRLTLGIAFSILVASLGLFAAAVNSERADTEEAREAVATKDAIVAEARIEAAKLRQVAAAAEDEFAIGEAEANAAIAQAANAVVRDARLQAAETKGAPHSDALVLGWGLAFATLLAVAYLPAHLALRHGAFEIVETYRPLPTVATDQQESFDSSVDSRNKLRAELGAAPDLLTALQGSSVVLAPLLAAVVSAVLGGL